MHRGFTRREDLEKHIRAGAQFVILSAPLKSEEVETVIHGVGVQGRNSAIISCSSCTTNALRRLLKSSARPIGVEKAAMTTVHERSDH